MKQIPSSEAKSCAVQEILTFYGTQRCTTMFTRTDQWASWIQPTVLSLVSFCAYSRPLSLQAPHRTYFFRMAFMFPLKNWTSSTKTRSWCVSFGIFFSYSLGLFKWHTSGRS